MAAIIMHNMCEMAGKDIDLTELPQDLPQPIPPVYEADARDVTLQRGNVVREALAQHLNVNRL